MNTMTCSLIVFRNSVILPLPVPLSCPLCCVYSLPLFVHTHAVLYRVPYPCRCPLQLLPSSSLWAPLPHSAHGLTSGLIITQSGTSSHSSIQSAFKHSVLVASSSSALPWDLQYSTFPSSYQRVDVEVNRIITTECKFAIFRTYTSARRGNSRAQDNGRIIINCTREGRTVVYKSTRAQQQWRINSAWNYLRGLFNKKHIYTAQEEEV